MYGTIFNLKVKSGHEEGLLNAMSGETTSKPKGMVALFVMKPDEKEGWIGVVVFESKSFIENNGVFTGLITLDAPHPTLVLAPALVRGDVLGVI